jgi:mitogen-activated protein kinase kinase kinase 5
MHPEIHIEMSERAKSFILRCFEPDPDSRATSAELLEDNFLNEYEFSVYFNRYNFKNFSWLLLFSFILY